MAHSAVMNAVLVPLVLSLAAAWAILAVSLVSGARRAQARAAVGLPHPGRGEADRSSAMLPEEQVRQLEALVSGTERRMLLRVALALPERSPGNRDLRAVGHHVPRPRLVVEQASAWRGPRANWRRIAALRLLASRATRASSPAGQAVGDHDRRSSALPSQSWAESRT